MASPCGRGHGPGHQDVFADTDSDILAHHYYADSGAALLGVNRLGRGQAGRPCAHRPKPSHRSGRAAGRPVLPHVR
ncbi:hypothetical protein ACH4GE_36295 [Streptomyces tendae]|uniref:hypothetical protein n=1 Tax=Streptomyces tendae TaxID=1932 RepID=UPI0037BC0495